MPLSRRRRVAVYSLLAGGVIVAVLAIFAVWTARQLLDEGAWGDTSQQLIADPAVTTALAGYLTDQLYSSADVQARLASVLPPRLVPLAAPAAGALRQPTETAIFRLLQRPRVQRLWQQAVRATHDQFIDLVEDRGRAIRLQGGGAVVLDLRPMLATIGSQLGLELTGERLPNMGQIEILRSKQLDALQKAVKLLKAVAWILFGLAIVLLGLAIWLARGRRRRITAAAALSVVGAAVIVLLARRLIGGGVVGNLADTATAQAAADAVYGIGTSLLAQIARTVLMLGLLLLLAAWLAGPGALAVRLRRYVRPALVGEPAIVHGAVLVALLALLALGIVPGIRTTIAALLLVVVSVVGVEMVRRAAVADAAVPA
jgi:hypothetical protein